MNMIEFIKNVLVREEHGVKKFLSISFPLQCTLSC